MASIGRSAAGFAIAVAVAVPLGLLIGWYRPVARFLQPLLELARNTAALALLPVFTLLLGIGELSKVTLVVYACVWPVLLNTIMPASTPWTRCWSRRPGRSGCPARGCSGR